MNPGGVFIMVGDRYVRILLPRVLYFQAEGDMVRMVSMDTEMECRASLESIRRILPIGDFCQVHPLFIVSTNKIIDFDEYSVSLPGISIPVDRSFRKQFYARCLFFSDILGKPGPNSFYIDWDGELQSH